MRKVIAALLLFALSVLPVAAADPWQAVAEKVGNSVVRVNSEDGSCTGFVVNAEKRYVQSAAHCYSTGRIWVDLVNSFVVALDETKDLMILEVKDLDPAKTTLQLATKNPVVMQDVMSVGFGYGLERPQFRAAKISDVAMLLPELSGPFVAVNIAFTPGQSGGPVVDSNGNVVSLVQRGDNGTLGIGVGADTIRERVGRFWSNK
jgi:S1-C subfamily serine protease